MGSGRDGEIRESADVHADGQSQSEEDILDYWTEERLADADPVPMPSPKPGDVVDNQNDAAGDNELVEEDEEPVDE